MSNRVKAGENIFEVLGFDNEESENLKIRAALMLEVSKYIQEHSMKQVEAAKFFQVTQPRISDLISGKIEKFTIDNLVNMLGKANKRVTFHVAA
ncbi:MAG: XRE family transcriptional regulator [Nitrospinae bacterium]|nr:XRE family transcriptional regulator [Nitrospinota bacterium]